jgi:hypothetical protein
LIVDRSLELFVELLLLSPCAVAVAVAEEAEVRWLLLLLLLVLQPTRPPLHIHLASYLVCQRRKGSKREIERGEDDENDDYRTIRMSMEQCGCL